MLVFPKMFFNTDKEQFWSQGLNFAWERANPKLLKIKVPSIFQIIKNYKFLQVYLSVIIWDTINFMLFYKIIKCFEDFHTGFFFKHCLTLS